MTRLRLHEQRLSNDQDARTLQVFDPPDERVKPVAGHESRVSASTTGASVDHHEFQGVDAEHTGTQKDSERPVAETGRMAGNVGNFACASLADAIIRVPGERPLMGTTWENVRTSDLGIAPPAVTGFQVHEAAVAVTPLDRRTVTAGEEPLRPVEQSHTCAEQVSTEWTTSIVRINGWLSAGKEENSRDVAASAAREQLPEHVESSLDPVHSVPQLSHRRLHAVDSPAQSRLHAIHPGLEPCLHLRTLTVNRDTGTVTFFRPLSSAYKTRRIHLDPAETGQTRPSLHGRLRTVFCLLIQMLVSDLSVHWTGDSRLPCPP